MASLKQFAFLLLSALLCFTNVIRAAEAAAEEAVAETGEPIIGIDLGTTFSCVAYLGENGDVQIFANEQGHRITPSWFSIDKEGNYLVGDSAKNQASSNPENTVFDAKRLIGRKFDEPTVKADVKKWPFKIVNKNGNPNIQLSVKGEAKDFAPEEISARILIKMKEVAEASLGREIKKAVVTVPAYFNDAQRQATKIAGKIAGLEVVRILNEPTAAAIAYGLDVAGEKNIVVFDLGGGTFDVSLLTFENGVFEVKAVNGNNHLGGQDFDYRIMEWAVKDIKAKHNIDVKDNKKIMSRLRREAEKAKIVLSNLVEAPIDIESIGEGKDYYGKLSRAKFDELNKDLFDSCIKPVETAMADAGWKKTDVNHIVLVGGSTRIPKVQELLKKYFDGKELDKKVNPDEAVAYGAAMQAGVLMGNARTKDILVIDATPLTLSIEVSGGLSEPLINRNTAIPTKKSKIFSTASDNQSVVSIKIFEGERSFAKDNHLLGAFDLSGIPLAPRGIPQIEVTFDLDANGILMVSAVDKASTKNQKSIRISNDKSRLSQAEIDRMLKEAEEYKEEDTRRKELVESRDGFERYLYQLKSQVEDEKELGSKIDKDDKATLLEAIAEANKWCDENKESATKEDFEEQKAKVEKIAAPIMTKLYQAGGAGEAPQEEAAAAEDHDEL